MWQQLLSLLQLTRLGLTFTAVSGCWLMLFLAVNAEPGIRRNPAIERWPVGVLLLLTAVVAAGLHGYGVALNDLLDVRRDRVFHPRRPLPSGRLGPHHVVVVAVLCLLAAVMAAVAMGTGPALVCLMLAVAILFYNATGKHLPATGIVTLGLIRTVGMFLPNPELGFAWPVVLSMTHVIVCATVVYHLEGKRPRLQPAEQFGIAAGWAFWTLVLVAWMGWRGGLQLTAFPRIWVGPTVAAALFAIVSWWTIRATYRRSVGGPRAAATFLRAAGLWLIVYDVVWLWSAGLWWPGTIHAALLVVACLALGALRPPSAKAEFRLSASHSHG